MKLKLILATAILALGGTVSHAAEKMDCCKDGKCACCAPKPGDDQQPHEGMSR